MLVATAVQMAQIPGDAAQEAQLLDAEVGLREMRASLPGVRRIDQGLQHVHRNALDPVAKEEPIAAREAVEHGRQPDDEAVMGLEGRSRFPCPSLLARSIGPPCNDLHSRKILLGASPPGPPGKGVRIQGISVRATRKPTPSKLFRFSVIFL